MMGSLACGIGGLMIAELDRRGAFDDGSWCGEGRKEGRKAPDEADPNPSPHNALQRRISLPL